MSAFLLVSMLPVVLAAVLALPALASGRPPWNLLRGVAVSFAGVMLPLFLFFASALIIPEWKGACRCGWIDGFLVGKVALSPLVLFATVSLYWIEVVRPSGFERPGWVRLGLYCGAMTSAGCVLYALWCQTRGDGPAGAVLVVLCYVPIWYAWRASQQRSSNPHYLGTTVAMAPFWIASALWARRVFEALPDQAPRGCFVVTAATRGHVRIVGPFFEIERQGISRHINHQLLTFWQFEQAWQARSPHTHAWFRAIYNRLGPRLAARIRSPWTADLVYLMLKPIELVIRPQAPAGDLCSRGTTPRHHPVWEPCWQVRCCSKCSNRA